MASVKLQLTNLNAVKKAIKKKIAEEVFPKAMKTAQTTAIPLLIDEFNESIRRTQAIQGLLGKYAGDEMKDAQAHLGLTNESAEQSVYEIEKIIGLYIQDTESLSKTQDGIIGFRFTTKNLADRILSIPSSTYNSTNGDINWLEWLIRGGNVDAEISFKISNRESTLRVSRSERALMIGGGDWNIDDYNRFAENGNFIADAILDEIWIAQSEKIIINEIKKALRNINV
jgi:hypothetical protein